MLHLDDTEAEAYRAAMISTVDELTRNEVDYKKTIAVLIAEKSKVDAATSAAITSEVVNLTQQLNRVQAALAVFR